MTRPKPAQAAAAVPAEPAPPKPPPQRFAPGLETLLVPLGSLAPDPRNAKRHPERQLADLAASLQRFGQHRPAVARRSSRQLILGHAMVEAAKRLGWEEIAALFVDDDEATALARGIADNRISELGEWDQEALATILSEVGALGDGFEGLGFTADEALASMGEPPAAQDLDHPAPPENPVSVPGDVWLLGSHRLLCGDAFDQSRVLTMLDGSDPDVLLTDPPYGIDLDTDYSKIKGSARSMCRKVGRRNPVARTYRRVRGDAKAFDVSALVPLLKSVHEQFWFGGNYYRRSLGGTDLDGSWLVWDKRPAAWNPESAGIDDAIGSGFELIWSRQKHQQRVLRFQWNGFTARNPGIDRAHPTEKPIALLVDMLERWTKRDQCVLDLFAGSGTTLVACEHAQRKCLAVELDPAYCDVIVQRWQMMTEGRAQLAGADKQFAEVAADRGVALTPAE